MKKRSWVSGLVLLLVLPFFAMLGWSLFDGGPRGRTWSLPRQEEVQIVQGRFIRVVEPRLQSGSRRWGSVYQPARLELAASDGSTRTLFCSPESPLGTCFDPIAAVARGQPLTVRYFTVRNVSDTLQNRDILLEASDVHGQLVSRQKRVEDLAWDAKQSDRDHQLGTWLVIALVVIFGPVMVMAIKYDPKRSKNA